MGGQASPQSPNTRSLQPFGKYLLIERLAIGGMAEVYIAKALGHRGGSQPGRTLQKLFAIKRILPMLESDQDFIKMFIDEASIASQLQHPNIVRMVELGKADDTHYIALEFVWGKDLLAVINRFRRLKEHMPFRMAAWIGAEMCAALHYAHTKLDRQGKPMNLVHRDVSPQNCIVSYEGSVRLIDFGIARASSRATQTQAGVLKGKFGYMSPEQSRARALDGRSDLFAVATCLWEMLASARLFAAESEMDVLLRVQKSDVPDLSARRPDIPRELLDIIRQAHAVVPANRFNDARQMELALRQAAKGFDRVAMAEWMQNGFADERQAEHKKLVGYRDLGGPAISPQSRASFESDPPFPPERTQPSLDEKTDRSQRLFHEQEDGATEVFPQVVASMERVKLDAQAARKGNLPSPPKPLPSFQRPNAPSAQPIRPQPQLTHDSFPHGAPVHSQDATRVYFSALDEVLDIEDEAEESTRALMALKIDDLDTTNPTAKGGLPKDIVAMAKAQYGDLDPRTLNAPKKLPAVPVKKPTPNHSAVEGPSSPPTVAHQVIAPPTVPDVPVPKSKGPESTLELNRGAIQGHRIRNFALGLIAFIAVAVGVALLLTRVLRPAVGAIEVYTPGPGLEVFLDGQRQGVGPLRIEQVSVGQHLIEVRSGAQREEHRLSVVEGDTSRVTATLASP